MVSPYLFAYKISCASDTAVTCTIANRSTLREAAAPTDNSMTRAQALRCVRTRSSKSSFPSRMVRIGLILVGNAPRKTGIRIGDNSNSWHNSSPIICVVFFQLIQPDTPAHNQLTFQKFSCGVKMRLSLERLLSKFYICHPLTNLPQSLSDNWII